MQTQNIIKKSFIFYENFFSLSKDLCKTDKLKLYEIICNFMFYSEININYEKLSCKLRMALKSIIPLLEKQNINYEKSKKQNERRDQERRETEEERRKANNLRNDFKNFSNQEQKIIRNTKEKNVLNEIHKLCKDDEDGHSDTFYLQKINKLGTDRVLGELKEIISNNKHDKNINLGKKLTNRLRSISNE
jgi:hypothetical protein